MLLINDAAIIRIFHTSTFNVRVKES